MALKLGGFTARDAEARKARFGDVSVGLLLPGTIRSTTSPHRMPLSKPNANNDSTKVRRIYMDVSPNRDPSDIDLRRLTLT
jgi:hypothetical protein